MVRKMSRRMGKTAAVALMIVVSVVVMTWRSSLAQFTSFGQSAIVATSSTPQEPTYYDEPDEYDLKAIQAAPAAYYGRSVPSRVWQIAPFSPGDEKREEIMILGSGARFVAANSRQGVSLTVRAKPGRPVTFTALDQGRFVNGRYSITVPANEDGYASVDFWVGDPGGFRVLAGSPENHGPAEFSLQALPPAELHDLESGEYAKKYWATFFKSPQAKKLLSRSTNLPRNTPHDAKN